MNIFREVTAAPVGRDSEMACVWVETLTVELLGPANADRWKSGRTVSLARAAQSYAV